MSLALLERPDTTARRRGAPDERPTPGDRPERPGTPPMTVTTDRAERTATSAVLPTDGAISVADRCPPGTSRSSAACGPTASARTASARMAHGYDQLGHAGNLTNFRLAAGAKGTYQALGAPMGLVFPFLDTDVYKWLEAVGWELGRGPDAGARSRGRRGHRARRGGAAPGRLPEHVRAGRRRRAAVPRPAVGPRAVLLRPPGPGGDRVASLDRRRPPARRSRSGPSTTVEAELGPGGRDGDRRAPRDRDGPRGAVPDHGRPATPRARATDGRPARPRPPRARAVRPGVLAGPRSRSATPRTVAGHAVRQMYLDCGVVDLAVGARRRGLLRVGPDALARHDRDADVPDRRARQPPQRRGVRRPVRAAAGPGVRRDVRLDRERDARLAAAARDRRSAPAPTSSSGRSTTASCPACRSTGTAFFYVNTLQRRTDRARRRTTGSGERQAGSPAPAARRTSCACSARGSSTSRRPTRSGIQLHQYADARAARRPGGRVRSACGSRPTTRGAAGSRSRSSRRRRRRGRCRCASRAGASSASVESAAPAATTGPGRRADRGADALVDRRRRGRARRSTCRRA